MKMTAVLKILTIAFVSGVLMFCLGYRVAIRDKEEYAQRRFIEIILWGVHSELITLHSDRLHNPEIMEELRLDRLDRLGRLEKPTD